MQDGEEGMDAGRHWKGRSRSCSERILMSAWHGQYLTLGINVLDEDLAAGGGISDATFVFGACASHACDGILCKVSS